MTLAALLNLASNIAGYLGAAMIALGYFLNQSGRLRSADWRYPAMNLAGSALVMISLIVHPNLPSIVIEAFWAAISLYGVRKNLRAARSVRP